MDPWMRMKAFFYRFSWWEIGQDGECGTKIGQIKGHLSSGDWLMVVQDLGRVPMRGRIWIQICNKFWEGDKKEEQ